MNPNPSAPQNNRHHEGGYRSQQEVDDMLLGRGIGDPDMYTPPWEKEDTGTYEQEPSDIGTTALHHRRQTRDKPF